MVESTVEGRVAMEVQVILMAVSSTNENIRKVRKQKLVHSNANCGIQKR